MAITDQPKPLILNPLLFAIIIFLLLSISRQSLRASEMKSNVQSPQNNQPIITKRYYEEFINRAKCPVIFSKICYKAQMDKLLEITAFFHSSTLLKDGFLAAKS